MCHVIICFLARGRFHSTYLYFHHFLDQFGPDRVELCQLFNVNINGAGRQEICAMHKLSVHLLTKLPDMKLKKNSFVANTKMELHLTNLRTCTIFFYLFWNFIFSTKQKLFYGDINLDLG